MLYTYTNGFPLCYNIGVGTKVELLCGQPKIEFIVNSIDDTPNIAINSRECKFY